MSMLLILKGLYNTINTPLYEKKWNLDEFRTLVGGLNHSEKYDFVNWDDDYSQYFWENAKLMATKPPTRTSKLSHFPTSAI